LFARFDLLVTDVAISPRGDLYVSCHSGPPDWGTGPQGAGHLFRISYVDPKAPQPLHAWPESPTEVRVTFHRPVDPSVLNGLKASATAPASHGGISIEFGTYVRAADRLETLKPPYAVVRQQDATPRGHLAVRAARLEHGGRTLVLTTDPHPLQVTYALTLPGIKAVGATGPGTTVDLDYTLTEASRPQSMSKRTPASVPWDQPVAWAPALRASSGTDSRSPQFEPGDWENGRALFHGDKLQCAKCHRTETRPFPSRTGTAVVLSGVSTDCVSCPKDPHLGQVDARCETCHQTTAFAIPSFVHRGMDDFFGGFHGKYACKDFLVLR
jgi:hypothetical protein